MFDIQERLNELDRALEQLRMPLDVMQRLHNAEQAINRIQSRQDQAEADTSERFKGISITMSRGDDSVCDLVTRTANAIYKELKALEGQFASTSRVERISEELGELRGLLASHKKIFFSAVGDLNDRIEMLEDAATWVPPDDTKITSEPDDTSWHPFNFSTDLRPADGKRVVVLTRADHINGPLNADAFDWGERGDSTIIAWRYAKEGE